MRSYEAARGYFSFLSFVSWIAIIGGALLGVTAAIAVAETTRLSNPEVAMFFAAVPGLALAAVGFFGLVFVQSSRAAVDSAEYAQQALNVSRNQLEVSQQLLKLAENREATAGYEAPVSSADLKPVSYNTEAKEAPAPERVLSMVDHHGRKIEETAQGFVVEGQSFASLTDAKTHVVSLLTERPKALVEDKT